MSQGSLFPLVDEVLIGTPVETSGLRGVSKIEWEMSSVPSAEVAAVCRRSDLPKIDGLEFAEFAADEPAVVALATPRRPGPETASGIWLGAILDREIFR